MPNRVDTRRPPRGRSAVQPRGDDRDTVIYGVHAAEAALANTARRIVGAMLTRNAADRFAAVLAQRGITPSIVPPDDIDRRLGSAVHQGVLLQVEPLPPLPLGDAVALTPLVVLDQLTDPHNVGAIWRSAAAFGAGAIVMTARHSPPITGALAKAASGAVDHVPHVLVGNLAQALAMLGECGVTRVGLDSEAGATMDALPLGADRIALVLGAEDKGLRRLTREHCDHVVRLETGGALASLNVSNAAAIALYLVARASAGRSRDG